MLPPRTIWIDADDWEHAKRRLVVIQGDTPDLNLYYLEYKESDLDAMGRPRWAPSPLDWSVFKAIIQKASFPPVPIES